MSAADSSLERLLLDNAEQMILLVEPENLRIVLANQVAQNTLGYAEAELLARHYDQHLLLDPAGVPWVEDGQRCQPQLVERQAFHQACRDWLQGNGQRFCELSGGWDERRQAALAQVATLLGLANQHAGPGH